MVLRRVSGSVLSPISEQTPKPFLKQFPDPEKCFKKDFGDCFEPEVRKGSEQVPKPFLEHFADPEKCFKKGFRACSEPDLRTRPKILLVQA